MIGEIGGNGPVQSASSGVGSADERLRQAAEEMEGVFVQYLTKALRATVPEGGSPDAPGADMYASLLDEHLAEVMAADTRTGIAEVLYRQLSGVHDPNGDLSIQSASTPVEGSEL